MFWWNWYVHRNLPRACQTIWEIEADGMRDWVGPACKLRKYSRPLALPWLFFYCYLILKYAGYTAKKRFLTKWRLAPKRKKKQNINEQTKKKKKYRLVYHEVQCNYLLVTFNCVPVGPKCVLSVKYDMSIHVNVVFRQHTFAGLYLFIYTKMRTWNETIAVVKLKVGIVSSDDTMCAS